MHCIKISTFKRFIGNTGVDFLVRPQFRQFYKNAYVKDIPKNLSKSQNQDGIFKRLSTRFDLYRKKYYLMGLGYNLYDDIPDRLNYSIFFKGFNMPDTFFSWFLITELHVWMLMVRFMAEGNEGKAVVTYMIESMWHDVMIRADLLGPIAPRIKKKQIMELSSQFNAAIIAYDEGIMSDDKVLACALWSRFVRFECTNPEQIEKLLVYVRKQISAFDKIPSEKLFHRSIAKWVEL